MAFQVQISEQDRSVVFHLSGKLIDEADAIRLNDLIDQELNPSRPNAIFHLEGLTHCNSSGINVFVRSITKTRIKGGDSFLTNINPALNELFRISRVIEIFNIFTSIEEVIKHIQSNKK